MQPHPWQRHAIMALGALVISQYVLAAAFHMGWLGRHGADRLDHAIAAAKTDGTGLPQVEIANAGPLWSAYHTIRLDLAAVRAGDSHVPRIFLASLPERYLAVEDVAMRKELFISTLLPLVLRANEEIMRDRARLAHLAQRLGRGDAIADADHIWLDNLAGAYGAAAGDLAELIRRVDTISPALALAQAAVESGWGRSRFAREGNALYGQRTWNPDDGIVPAGSADADFAVRAFDHLLDSVRAYARNLNSHAAYGEFRARRAHQRAGERDPRQLADTLVVYSERPREYVTALRDVIAGNALHEFDDAQLIAPKTLTAGL